jgi:hypothetical protein
VVGFGMSGLGLIIPTSTPLPLSFSLRVALSLGVAFGSEGLLRGASTVLLPLDLISAHRISYDLVSHEGGVDDLAYLV